MQAGKALLQAQSVVGILQKGYREWLSTDAQTLIYMAKAIIAGIMALVISMMLNLPDPRTAIFTTFIVMQPQSGLVFSKSFYRVLGTTAGVIVSLLVVGAFAQEPFYFILVFALWIGLTTGAGLKYRNFQAYGFVLAGYTLCIVALPVIEHPLDIFDIATSRFSEVLVGIVCATVVSDVIFPRKLTNSLLASERERFVNALVTLAKSESIFDTKSESDANTFSSGVVGLQALRANTSFESGIDQKSRNFSYQLNHEYMNLQTTFHSLKSVLNGLHVNAQLRDNLVAIYEPLAQKLKTFSTVGVLAEDINLIAQALKELQSKMKERVDEEQKRLKVLLDIDDYELFVSASHLILRLSEELQKHCHTYTQFLDLKNTKEISHEPSQVVRFKTSTDNLLVALAALRGSGVLIASMLFWILSGWPYATITITLSVVISLLIGTLPRPLDVTVNFFKGAFSAVFVAGIYDFFIVPQYATDMVTLSLVLIPALGFIAWMTTKPKWSGFGLGFVFLLMSQSPFDLYYKIDPTIFLETTVASLLGIIFAGVGYMVVNFWSCSLTQRRVAKLLRIQLINLCSKPLTMQRGSLESLGRDLLQQFSTQGRLNVRSSRYIFEWLLSTLEIGRAIIAVRATMKKVDSGFLNQKITSTLEEMKNYLEHYKQSDLAKLFLALKESVEVFERMEIDKVVQNRVIVELLIIQTMLKNTAALPILQEDICH